MIHSCTIHHEKARQVAVFQLLGSQTCLSSPSPSTSASAGQTSTSCSSPPGALAASQRDSENRLDSPYADLSQDNNCECRIQ
ncbi:hypothetical protein AOLI_G00229190 [Acnodon oligacanthus]